MTLELTQNYLRECFDYEPETGLGTWRIRPLNHFPTARGWRIFNRRYAGEIVGNFCNDGYINIQIDGINYRFHRLAFVWMTGEQPNEIDHINGVRDDNRWCNLRNGNRFGNQKNVKRRIDNTSGQTGVSWHAKVNKWEVSIYVNKKSIYLGVYSDYAEAIAIRKAAEIEYGFSETHGRD